MSLLDSVGGKGIIGNIVRDVEGIMGSGGLSGGLGVVFTVFIPPTLMRGVFINPTQVTGVFINPTLGNTESSHTLSVLK